MEEASEAGRKLRVKERKQYSEDCLQDVDIEGQRMFSVEEKLLSDKFPQDFVLEMKGENLTLEYFQREGFTQPMVYKEKKGLGIRVPSEHFSVNDVRQCVGSRRIVDVMDVTTQKDQEMTMKEWCHYFEEKPREKLLNVISLEFSHTKLENYVESPDMVRKIDWVDCVWPRHLKESQIAGTNTIENMKYPKVQKYCLMSVKGCYTDFHIDFGGTSVWYHIIKGQKVFWLIPPTEDNIRHYEKWVLSGKQGDVFFGDTVPKCARIYLEQGYTFLIPTGWIHAVYTPADSIVFGGNFLHSFGIEKQLRISEVEDTTKVPLKFRYPFYTELLWYVLQRYVLCVSGKNHLTCNDDGEPLGIDDENLDPSKAIKKERTNKNGIKGIIHLTKYELSGLKALIKYLERLPSHKKYVPSLIRNADHLLKDAREMVREHSADDHIKAITGKLVLTWPEKPIKKEKEKKKLGRPCKWQNHTPSFKKAPTTFKNGLIRHRRTRCKRCEPCLRNDCEECNFCRDMKKFGGPGRMKQSCRMRQCVGPVLAHSAICNICKEDGWQKKDKLLKWLDDEDLPSLMECSLCWEITHPTCLLATRSDNVTPHYNDDLPNSWQCIKCIAEGAPEEVKPRSMKIKKFKTFEDENGDFSQEEKKRKYHSEDEDSNHSLKKPYTEQTDIYIKQEKDSSDDSTLPSSNHNFPLKKRLMIKPPLCTPLQEGNFDYLFETSSSDDMDEDEDTLDSVDEGSCFDVRLHPPPNQVQANKDDAYSNNNEKNSIDHPLQPLSPPNKQSCVSELEQDILKTIENILDRSVSLYLEESKKIESKASEIDKSEEEMPLSDTSNLPFEVIPPETDQRIDDDSTLIESNEGINHNVIPMDTQENLLTSNKINFLQEKDPKMSEPFIGSTSITSIERQRSCDEISHNPSSLHSESMLEVASTFLLENKSPSKEIKNAFSTDDIKNDEKTDAEMTIEPLELENSDYSQSSTESSQNATLPLKGKFKSIDIKIILKPLEIHEINRLSSFSPQEGHNPPPLVKHVENNTDTSTFSECSQESTEIEEFDQKIKPKPPDTSTENSLSTKCLQEEINGTNENCSNPDNYDEKSLAVLEDSQDTIEMNENLNIVDSHKEHNESNKSLLIISEIQLPKEKEFQMNTPTVASLVSSNNSSLSTSSDMTIETDNQLPLSKNISLENKNCSKISYPFRYRKCKNLTYLPYKTINLLNKQEVMEVLSHPKAPQVVLKKLDEGIVNALLPSAILDKEYDNFVNINQSKDERHVNKNKTKNFLRSSENYSSFSVSSSSSKKDEISSLSNKSLDEALASSSSQITPIPSSALPKEDTTISSSNTTKDSFSPVSSLSEPSNVAKIETQPSPTQKPKEIVAQDKHLMSLIFRFLNQSELFACQMVCKDWNEWALDPKLWQSIDVSHKQITPYLLMGIVKRQPVTLDLSYTTILGTHVSWLIARLPNLKHLVMRGCSLSAVSSLWTAYCPYLHSLDISSVFGLDDSLLDRLLSLPEDSNSKRVKNRLRQLKNLDISHTDISDVSIRLIAHRLPLLTTLKAAGCNLITDMGIAVLGATRYSMLTYLDLSSCSAISDTSLEALSKCIHLTSLDLRDCSLVSEDACKIFASTHHATITAPGKLLKKL